MSFKCKACGQEFETERKLHSHLKKHDLRVAAYYQQYYPRYDLYDGKIINPAWNRFAHITYRAFSANEYETYFSRTNGGKIFENELLNDYEPAGSLKYYEIGTNTRQTNELQNQLNQVEYDASFETPNIEQLTNDVRDTLDTIRSNIQSLSFDIVRPISTATLNRIAYHKDNLQAMWWTPYDKDPWRVIEKKGSKKRKKTARNFI